MRAQLLFVHHTGRNAEVPCPLQCVGTGVIGDDQSNLAVGDLAGSFRFQQSLQIGAAAGDQDCDSLFQSRITFSSFSTMEPMT